MNLDKSDIKILTAHELGCKLDDFLESNTKDMYRLEGGVVALRSAALSMEGLMKVIDKEMDEGKFDLEQAVHIKRFVQRAHQIITNLVINHDNNRMTWQGRMQAFELAVEMTKKFQTDESKKATVLREAIAQNQVVADGLSHEVVDADVSRLVAVRPGMTLKERRLAELVEQGRETKVPTEEHVPSAILATTSEEPPIPRKRGRPKKV